MAAHAAPSPDTRGHGSDLTIHVRVSSVPSPTPCLDTPLPGETANPLLGGTDAWTMAHGSEMQRRGVLCSMEDTPRLVSDTQVGLWVGPLRPSVSCCPYRRPPVVFKI